MIFVTNWSHRASIQETIQTINETFFQQNILSVCKTLDKLTLVAIQSVLKLSPITTSTRASSNRLLKRFKIRTMNYGLRSINYQSVIHWNTLRTKQNQIILYQYHKLT